MLIDNNHKQEEFLAILAHELRNPLNATANAFQIIKNKLGSNETRQDIYKAIDIADRQLMHMGRLIDDLLDVSRISCGKIVLHKRDIDLCEVIKNAVETAKPLVNKCHHTLELNIPKCPIWVNGDATKLTQLFSNLLNNAAKYTNNNGIITMSVVNEGNNALIKVKDNGIGIPANKLPYIFDMFMQVDQYMEQAQGGLGIGLMLVKSIAEMHNGKVEVKSDNKGTEFTVSVPVLHFSKTENDLEFKLTSSNDN